MTTEKKPEDMSPAGSAPETETPATAPNATPEAATPAAKGPEQLVIARLEAETADLRDRLLRAHAEMDNVRKRLEREKADASKYAISKFARDVVGIGDNVQRALDAVPTRSMEQDPSLKSFVEGVTMIEREFISVLGRHGVKRLDPKGEPFDPNLHQAVVEVPSPDIPAGKVAQVFQHGYVIEDRILRPAMVAVSKGGPKPATAPEASAGAQTSDQSEAVAPSSTIDPGSPSAS